MEAIRTAQLHLNEVHMILDVVIHVGGEFERVVGVADLAEKTFVQLVGLADLAEVQGECREQGVSRGVAGGNAVEDIQWVSWRVRALPRERDHDQRGVPSRSPCPARHTHALTRRLGARQRDRSSVPKGVSSLPKTASGA